LQYHICITDRKLTSTRSGEAFDRNMFIPGFTKSLASRGH